MMVLKQLADPPGVQRVEEQNLHSGKSGLRCRTEALVDVELRPQHREVRGVLRHYPLSVETFTPAGSSHNLTSDAMSSSPIPRARASEKRCSARPPNSSGMPPARASS